MERNYDEEIIKFISELEDEVLNALQVEEVGNEDIEKEDVKETIISELKGQAKKLEDLANFKDAMFSFDEEEDKFIKEHVKAYMMWFRSIAYKIEEITKVIDENMK